MLRRHDSTLLRKVPLKSFIIDTTILRLQVPCSPEWVFGFRSGQDKITIGKGGKFRKEGEGEASS